MYLSKKVVVAVSIFVVVLAGITAGVIIHYNSPAAKKNSPVQEEIDNSLFDIKTNEEEILILENKIKEEQKKENLTSADLRDIEEYKQLIDNRKTNIKLDQEHIQRLQEKK